MAKDVDLTSKEWLDIVFDGKNKDFGAYEMRATSTGRHTKAVLIVLAGLAVILVLLILAITGVFSKADSDEGAVATEQENVALYDPEEEAEEEEEEAYIPPPEEEVMPKEEVANQIQNTIIDIVEDEQVTNEVKTQEELREDNRMIGGTDITDGVDDLTKNVITQEVIVVEEKPKEDNIVYTTANVQQQPEFPGGEAAMYKWLADHIQYPAVAAEEGVQGKVIVEFVVSKSGAIENAKVLRGPHKALEQEALRVVKSMPAWNPGRNNGQAVKVTYVLPVTFKLQK
ncbi:MAG: energy transducer TonB [Bacteroidales bacterium]|nr:energy transducer TonB [Bacteroidales bacterium]